LIQARAGGGMNSDLDATRQRALLAGLRARLPQLLELEARTINQLSLLLGERPGALQAELAAGADASAGSNKPAGLNAPAAVVLPDLVLGLPSELARRRPDIRQAEAKLHSATASIGVAVADLYPRITLGASFGLESIGSRDLGDWASRRWTVGPSLDLPLFDMGRRRSIVTLRNLQQQEAAVAYQQTVLKAWHEIDTALTAYTAERQRNQQLAEQQIQSGDAYRMARVRYKNGLTSFLDALDAQRKMLAAQRDYVASNSQLAIRFVAVHKALGAGDSIKALVGGEGVEADAL
jgi:outer membrane protein TolC